jgi:predicted DNA-binding protein
MSSSSKQSKTLKIRIEPELLELIQNEVKRLDTDVSTYIRWCIRTGLYLEDVNSFLSAEQKKKE